MKKLISMCLLATFLACAVSGCGPSPSASPLAPTGTSIAATTTREPEATAPSAGRCGDGVCGEAEDAQGCPQDCAQASPAPSPTDTPTPSPEAPQAITPANANQVTLMKILGQGQMFDAVWLPDGETLAAIYWTGIYLYDAETMAERQFIDSYGPTRRLAASPDGRYLAVMTGEDVQLWDIETSQVVRTLEGSKFLNHIAFSPDGRTLASACGGQGCAVQLWDVASGEIQLTLEPLSRGLSALAFSHDGQTIVATTWSEYSQPEDMAVRFWDVETGQPLPVEGDLAAAPDGISNLVYSPDGRLLAGSWSYIPEIHLWDAVSGETLYVLESPRVETLAFSPEGNLLASGSIDRTARIWDVTTGEKVMTIEGHTQEVIRVAFSPAPLPGTGGLLLATTTARDGLQLWDVTTGERVGVRAPEGHTDGVEAVAYSPDGRVLATGGCDGTMRLWEAASGAPLRVISLPGPGDGGVWGCFRSLAFSPEGTTLAGLGGSEIRLWDVETGEMLRVLEAPTGTWVDWDVAFSPDGQILAAGGDTGLLWDLASGQLLQALENPPTTLSVSFSPDGQTLSTGNGFGWIRLWDMPSGELLREMQGSSNSVRVVFSPDGETLASGSSGFEPDYAVRLWDVASGEIRHTLEGHTTDVRDLAFSPDGLLLASCSREGKTRLWDVFTGQEVQALEDEWSVYTLAFSPDGRVVATGGFDELVRLWGLEPGQ